MKALREIENVPGPMTAQAYPCEPLGTVSLVKYPQVFSGAAFGYIAEPPVLTSLRTGWIGAENRVGPLVPQGPL